MSWLFFTLLAALLWAAGQVILKKGFNNISSLWSIILSACVNLLIYIPFSLITHASLQISLIHLCGIFLISFLYIFYFYAIEKGQLAFTGTIFSTYPITTIILSSIFLQERLSLFQFFMVGLVVIGSVLLSLSPEKGSKKKDFKKIWILWAVFASITTGAGDFGAKLLLNNISFQTYTFYYPLMYVANVALFWMIDKKGRKFLSKPTPSKLSTTTIGVTMLTFGLLALSYAFTLQKVSIVTTISSSYMALTILFAYLFLKEKINRRQLFALFLIIIGVTFISSL
jgi:transporter family protein